MVTQNTEVKEQGLIKTGYLFCISTRGPANWDLKPSPRFSFLICHVTPFYFIKKQNQKNPPHCEPDYRLLC